MRAIHFSLIFLQVYRSIVGHPIFSFERDFALGGSYSLTVHGVENEKAGGRAGLCDHCRFMRLIRSDRGSTFYFCELSVTNPAFPKYPRLPVLHCGGYKPLVNESPGE